MNTPRSGSAPTDTRSVSHRDTETPAPRRLTSRMRTTYDPPMVTPPPAGASPAYAMGWNDAATGEPLHPGASPAYTEGHNDYHAQHPET